MSSTAPVHKMPKLIVVMAFEDDGEGGLRAAFEPREFQSEDRARAEASALAGRYAGIIAWSRKARPDIGEYGDPNVLYAFGQIPVME